MASHQDWYADKLSNLLQEDLRVSTLSELRDHLKSLPHEDAAQIVAGLQLHLVFDCLNDTNSEQVDLASEVLSICLSNLTLGESTNLYKTPLERALIHPYPVVKLMALKEIERSLSDEQVLSTLCEQTSLITNIVSCIGDSDLGVAQKASDIIVALGATIPGANKITNNDVLVSLQNVMSINEVVRLRVYEMIINISSQSGYVFNKFKTVGLISNILDEVGNNDVLLKMNIIELLSRLGQSQHGYIFLDENGILNKIFSLISEDELTTELCQPGIIRFFGRITNKKPREMLAKYPLVFDHLCSNIESSDTVIIGISLDTIGYIAQTPEGKLALCSTGRKIEGTIRTISKLLASLPTETRIKALQCIEHLLRTDRYDVMQITEQWYRLLGPDPMEVISKYAKNPFYDLRSAGLGILHAIAGQPWGQEAVKNTPGLIEFLLDRSIETNKECKEAKYEVVKLLSHSSIFERGIQERLESFVKEGPFYVQVVTEVAIEGN